MGTPTLHSWLSTPEALRAAEAAVQIPLTLMGGRANMVGKDELLSEALIILTECAVPPRETQRPKCEKCGGPLDNVRAGAKFCSPQCRKAYGMRALRGKAEVIPPRTGAHIGSMWSWPEGERAKYAIREVGYALNNWLRTRRHAVEVSATETLANLNVAVEEPDESPREVVESFLERNGVRTTGEETFEELCEAALHVRGETRSMHVPVSPIAA